MQFGVCGDRTVAEAAMHASYEYMEWAVATLLRPRDSDAAFSAALADARAAGLPCPAANAFVPADLKITGPAVDGAALRAYVTTAMRRAAQAGVELIVFGSGAARSIPAGFDRRLAHDQLVAFCIMAGSLAHDHGVTLVVEPLNRAESNLLTTVAECAALVQEVAHPAVRLLVDAYHLMRDDDSYAAIVTYGDLLSHAHIATVPNRLPPGAEPTDFTPFFAALARAGYRGRLSIEARIGDPEVTLPMAHQLMQTLADAAQATHGHRPDVGGDRSMQPPVK